MEKGPALVAAILFLSIPALAAACSGSDDSTFNNNGGSDASFDAPGTFQFDSSPGPDGSSDGTAPVQCKPTIADSYTAHWDAPTKPTKPGPCSTTDITGYYTECLATLGKPDGKTQCNTWMGANAACGKCIEPTNNSGPIQWYQDRFYFTINVGGCVAVEQDKYATTDCGGAYSEAVNCARDACDGCFKTPNATFQDFISCEKAAQNQGLCASLQKQQASVCPADLSSTDPTKECFRQMANTEDLQTFYTRVIGIFCGP